MLARHEVDGEAVERDDAEVLVPRGRLVDHLHPLGGGEELGLRRVPDHGDDDLVEDAEAALDEVEVPVVHGIEHAGIHRTLRHSSSFYGVCDGES